MKIYLASDHAGFHLKEKLFASLSKAKYDVEDVGDKVLDPADDYPQFAYAATTKVLGSEDEDPRAILICGSGQGMCIAANRIRGIRAALCWDEAVAKEARNDDDSNVLCIPARFIDEAKAQAVIETWLKTAFSKAERHTRRIREIEELYG